MTTSAAPGRDSQWSTPADIVSAARRRWDDGTLLRGYTAGAFEPITIALRGPRPSQIGTDLGAVRDWITALRDRSGHGERYDLTFATVGGRTIGRNEVPTHAAVNTLQQAVALLGVRHQVAQFDEIRALAAGFDAVTAWVDAHPLRALALFDVFPKVLAAFSWLDTHRGSGAYLREITAPGVDTKFTENHRGTLAAMLGVSAGKAGFLADLGLATRPGLVRMRTSPSFPVAPGLSEITCRITELGRLGYRPHEVLIIENEVTYLSAPVPEAGVAIFGSGFAVDGPARLPWLGDAAVRYWGDLDTHGFAILNRLRARVPHAQSVLMDAATLEAHRERWVTEAAPTSALLTRLTEAEGDVYRGLVEDRWARRVRLEQERVDWAWAFDRLCVAPGER